MFTIKDSTTINAPIERVFQLSTSIDIVRQTLGMTPQPAPPPARTTGLVLPNDTVHWRGWIFGLPQHHTSIISGYEAPIFFQDTQLTGRFAHFHHDHHLEWLDGHTLAYDEVHFALPFGSLGALVAKTIMFPHITGLLRRRFALLKHIAESDEWQKYLPA